MAKRKVKKILNMRSPFRTLSIKIYDEQIPDGWKSMCQIIRSLNKAEMQVIAICHNRDLIGDDIWEPSIEKPHYHIIVRIMNGKTMRVQQILGTLGIVFRKELDENLWKEHGVETCADFTDMTMYLPHWTEQAELDGKERYELEELVSNLTIEEIKQIMEGYTRVSDSQEKVTPRKLAELDKDAYNLGRNFGDFEAWYGSQPFSIRSQAKMRTIKESYERGINERVDSDETVARLCVFIQSEKNKGKTTAARHALKRLGKRYLDVSSGETGRFDDLKVTHDAIIVDDDKCGRHILNLADSKYTRVYRRNKNNPVWAGDYFIVTSNLSFERWIEECGIHDKAQVEAARSRFYVCKLMEVEELNRDILWCESQADRGGDDYLEKLDMKFVWFKEFFDESLMEYAKTKTGKRKRMDVNMTIVYPSDGPDALKFAKENEEERKRSAAYYEEELLAQFEEDCEPDEFLEAIMMRWYVDSMSAT